MVPVMLALLLGIPVAIIVYILFFHFGARDSGKPNRPVIIIPRYHDVDDQSLILPGPERIRRTKSPFFPHGELFRYHDPSVRTLYDNFLHGIEASQDGPCLGFRPTRDSPYEWISYQTVYDRAVEVGSGLIAMGNPPEQKTFIGIYAGNQPEWDIGSLATVCYSMVLVPIYDTLGANAVAYIVNHAELSTIICDTDARLSKLLSAAPECPSLRQIVVISKSGIPAEMQTIAADRRISLHSFDEVRRMGRDNPAPVVKPSPDDLYVINYTSGTTGTPKGVMLTHRNLMCHPHAFASLLEKGNALEDISPKTVGPLISYLPLAHNYAQCVHANNFYFGYSIGYWSGDIKHIQSDLKALRPWIMPTVPRVLNRVFNTIQAQLRKRGPISRLIFRLAYAAKLSQINSGIYRTDTIWDRLVFGKIQQEFGGMIALMFTGSAPISEEVLMMCRVVFGCPITEGYGQTETCSGAAITFPEDLRCGHVGVPVPFAEVKLVSVADMNYLAENDEGEVCVRGPNVMVGYFKDPEKTAEVLDDDGWLHSGDIGKWMPNGTLKLIDRKKHLFKLAQGEYVAPEKIEGVYQTNPIVEQVYVDGRSLERYIVGIVVPESHELRRVASSLGLGGSAEEVCRNSDFTAYVLKSLQDTGRRHGLAGFEQIRAVHVTTEPFSTDNDCMTATMKLKRPQCRKYYSDIFDELYQAISRDSQE